MSSTLCSENIYIYIYMVRYYGRARQRIGSVNTNQPGLKQAGCPPTVGKQGLIIQHLGKRVNCNLKTCGLPMSGLRCRYGVADAIGRDKTFMDIQNSNNPAIKDYCKQVVGGQNGIYCQWPQPRNRQNAGGVGNIWTSRRNHCEKTCSLGWKENYMSNHTPKELAKNANNAANNAGNVITITNVETVTDPGGIDPNTTGFGFVSPVVVPGEPGQAFGSISPKKFKGADVMIAFLERPANSSSVYFNMGFVGADFPQNFITTISFSCAACTEPFREFGPISPTGVGVWPTVTPPAPVITTWTFGPFDPQDTEDLLVMFQAATFLYHSVKLTIH